MMKMKMMMKMMMMMIMMIMMMIMMMMKMMMMMMMMTIMSPVRKRDPGTRCASQRSLRGRAGGSRPRRPGRRRLGRRCRG